MDGKVDVLGPIKMICRSFSVTYSFYALKKEWTEYRGVFFTIIALLQGFHLVFELFTVAESSIFDAGTVVVDGVHRIV